VTNKIDYFEIGSSDPGASKAFYGTLFGWVIENPTGPAPYSMVDEARGGLWDTSDMGAANWAIFYVRVDDVQAALDHAVRLGASVAIPLPTMAESSLPTFSTHSGIDLGSGDPKRRDGLGSRLRPGAAALARQNSGR